jgi:hypothetical protein
VCSAVQAEVEDGQRSERGFQKRHGSRRRPGVERLPREVAKKEHATAVVAARPRLDEIAESPSRKILHLVHNHAVESLFALLDRERTKFVIEALIPPE